MGLEYKLFLNSRIIFTVNLDMKKMNQRLVTAKGVVL